MNLFLQSTQHLNDTKSDQLRQVLRDLEHIKSLTKIRGNQQIYSKTCQYCKIPHNLDGEHNLVIYSYTEAQFIADLISEFDTLYQICNWAHQSIGKQIIRDSMTPNEKAWNHILSREYDQVLQYLNEEESMILNALRPQGRADKIFDFMEMSANWNENWVLTLEQLSNFVNRPYCEVNKLYQWAVCQSIDWQTGEIAKFNENLWINIRAELFYRVMCRHNDLYPKVRKCINFGINKPFLWVPQKYELNCGYMNDEIDRIGKKFIIVIINFLTTKDGLQGLVDIVDDAIKSIQQETDLKQSELRARCYYEIGLMLSDLLDLDPENNIQFMELIKILVKQVTSEQIDHICKQKYLIHLLSILQQNATTLNFIFEICQICIKSQGDSLSSFLQRMIEYNFQKRFITQVAFEQFSNLSPAQQNELLSSEFEQYFDEIELNQQFQQLLPVIVENLEASNETFERLFTKYYQIFKDSEEYYQIFKNKDMEAMLYMLSKINIPDCWFVKYITFILKQPNITYSHIQRIMEGIQVNSELFYKLPLKKEVLAQIARKLTQFQDFALYLLD